MAKRKLSEAEARKVSQAVRHAKLVDTSRRIARMVTHKDPPAASVKKRKSLEKSLGPWLRYYLPDLFPLRWSRDQRKAIKKIQRALDHGGLFAFAMARGGGKTTIVKGAVLYAILSGRRKYVVPIGATADLATAIIDSVRQQLMENEKLYKHYPHVCEYARRTEGKAIKARFQLRADGKASGIRWSNTTLVLPEVLSPKTGKPYASNGAIVEAHGLTGAIRGKWKDTKTGKTLRPDFVIPDDPQTRESAESVAQCNARERIITGDVLGLAGPRKKIAAVMPCTIIRKGDLAERFLSHEIHPEWQGEISSLVIKWPDAQETLWKQYAEIYREDVADGRETARATDFYRKRRSRMEKGATVSWAERVRDGELSALQTAENLLLETGPQFWAEYQNEPQDLSAAMYTLTPDVVLAHALPTLPRLALPDTATILVAYSDINRKGLYYCVDAFAQDMTGHIPAYGAFPPRGELWRQNAPELERKQAIFGGLRQLCSALAQTYFIKGPHQVRVSTLLVDRGYEPDVVHKFAASASYPFRVIPARGYAAHKYRVSKATLVGSPKEGCHMTRSTFGQFIAYSADLWRETSQRAWLADPGAPGGSTLHAVEDPRQHLPFAEQVTAEKLSNKYETDMGWRWEWRSQPGNPWDWGDALTGCYVAAAFAGLSPSGVTVKKRKYVEKRKAKVPVGG